MKKFDIEKIVVGDYQTNCYICYTDTNCVIIDPGFEPERIASWIRSKDLIPLYIINTHGHGDHMGGNASLKQLFPDIKIACHTDEQQMLLDSAQNLSASIDREIVSPKPDHLCKDGETFSVCEGIEFQIIHTPGHTRGGMCLKSGNVMFVGDTIFLESIGRTDLPGGDFESIIRSIRDKIFSYENCKLYPGHGPMTTTEHEQKFNPFLV